MRKRLARRALLAALTVAGLGLLMASRANAAVVYTSDFESDQGYVSGAYPSGGSPPYYADPSGGNGLDMQSVTPTWVNGGGNTGYVVANPNTSASAPAENGFPAGVANTSANAALAVGDNSGGAVRATTAALSLGTLSTTSDMTISQSCFYSSTNGDSKDILINEYGGADLPSLSFGEGGYFSIDDKHTNGHLTFCLGSQSGLVSPNLDPNEWHTATETIHFNQADLAASTLDFAVDGVAVAGGTGVSFDASGWASTPAVYDVNVDDYPDTSNNAGSGIYLDNVSITNTAPVPEPASLGAIALGAVLFLRRRSSKSRLAGTNENL